MVTGAAIVIIGNEILSGKVRDANSSFLVGELRELGVPVGRIAVVQDDPDAIVSEVRRAAEFDFAFTSGGVGPTLDDVTMPSLARAFDVPLVSDPRLEKVIRDHFGAATLPAHLRMARVPEGAKLEWHDGMPWPVMNIHNVMVLPGDPGLLRLKFLAVRERFRREPFVLRRVWTTLEEGALAPLLDAVDAEHSDVDLGSYPVYDDPEYNVQVTLESKKGDAVDRALERLLAGMDPRSIVKVD